MTETSRRTAFVVLCDGDALELERLIGAVPEAPERIVVATRAGARAAGAVAERFGMQVVSARTDAFEAEGVNAGLDHATRLGADYLCVLRSTIRMRSDVVTAAVAALDRNPALGMVAPSSVIVDGSIAGSTLSHRTCWDLETMRFVRECLTPARACRWVEADFCEFACAVLRVSAVGRVGRCDTAFTTAVGAADLGFRLGLTGYRSVYLPESQIEFASPYELLNPLWADPTADLQRFAAKHLGATVDDRSLAAPYAGGADPLADPLRSTLRRYGLRGARGPALAVLDSLGPAPRPPPLGERVERAASPIERALAIHPGVETDVFCPWGRADRLFAEPTYLAVVDGWDASALRTLRHAWRLGRDGRPPARLVVLGRGLAAAFGPAPDRRLRHGKLDLYAYPDEGIHVGEVLAPLADAERAELLRGVEAAVFSMPGQDVPIATLLEAQACGAAVLIAPGEGADRLARAGLSPALASRADDSAEGLATQIREEQHRDAASCALRAEERLAAVLAGQTWRSRAFDIHCRLAGARPQAPAGPGGTTAAVRAEPPPDGVPASGDRPRGRPFARRIQTLGQLTAGFGSSWEEQGLAATARLASVRIASALGRRAPPGLSRSGRALVRRLGDQATAVANRQAAMRPDRTLLIGYINGTLGLGESLRGLAYSLQRVGYPFSTYPFTIGIEDRQMPPVFGDTYDLRRPHGINLVEVSGDELPRVFESIGRRHFERSYTILRAWWELGRAPDAWRQGLALIDEIWAPNGFVADAFRPLFDGPITVVPPCVTVPDPGTADGAEAQPFTFLFSFDFHSFPQRKNPLAVVRAFRQAFPDPAAPVRLVLKSTPAPERYAAIRDALRSAAEQDPRILVREGHLSRDAMVALIRRCDCYVSLHRSEGFGLGMAEAMGLGRPVIGTGYSGNAEFLTEDNGYPVRYVLRPLAPGDYVHGGGQRWAEPDQEAGAAAMRRVFDHPDEAAAKAERGRRFVLQRYAAETVGRIAAARLEAIVAERRSR